MEFKQVFAILSSVAILALAAPAADDVDDVKERSVAAGLATAAAVASITSMVLKGLGSLFTKLNGPDNVKDVIVSGRGYKVTIHDGTTATVMDKNTGLIVTKTSTSSEAAVNDATTELVKMLIQTGHIDEHNIHLPPKAITQPPQLCKDKVDNCKHFMADGFCTPHGPFLDFMLENCFYSCANCGQSAF